MKKFAVLILALSLICGVLTACSKEDGKISSNDNGVVTDTPRDDNGIMDDDSRDNDDTINNKDNNDKGNTTSDNSTDNGDSKTDKAVPTAIPGETPPVSTQAVTP